MVFRADHSCPIEPRGVDDLACILYTSGTTGRSKGAMLSHGNLASNALALKSLWRWEDGDVLLHALPIFHVHGLFVALHGALLNGSTILFHRRFNADAVLADFARATVFMGIPTFYTRLLESLGSLAMHVPEYGCSRAARRRCLRRHSRVSASGRVTIFSNATA